MVLHDDRTFVRHFSWVIVGLVGVTILFIILSFAIVGASGINSHTGYTYTKYVEAHGAMQKAQAAASAQPAALGGTAPKAVAAAAGASAKVAAAATAQAGSSKTGAVAAAPGGAAIWKAHCAACHATGIAGAPKIGDRAAWGPILASTNLQTLYQHAINGYTGKLGTMPPKGGAMNLTDAEVEAAVKYMVDQSQ